MATQRITIHFHHFSKISQHTHRRPHGYREDHGAHWGELRLAVDEEGRTTLHLHMFGMPANQERSSETRRFIVSIANPDETLGGSLPGFHSGSTPMPRELGGAGNL